MEILRFRSRYMDFGKSSACQENSSKLCSESIKNSPKTSRNRIVNIKYLKIFACGALKLFLCTFLDNLKIQIENPDI